MSLFLSQISWNFLTIFLVSLKTGRLICIGQNLQSLIKLVSVLFLVEEMTEFDDSFIGIEKTLRIENVLFRIFTVLREPVTDSLATLEVKSRVSGFRLDIRKAIIRPDNLIVFQIVVNVVGNALMRVGNEEDSYTTFIYYVNLLFDLNIANSKCFVNGIS